MKVPSSISKILINKNFLYIIAFLSLTNILGYMMLGHLSHIVVFIVVGLIMSYFSKNMAVILLVSLIASNSYHITFAREGFEDGKDGNAKDTKKQNKKADSTIDSSEQQESTAHESEEAPTGESFEVGRGKRNSKIDYASTITDAYSQLNDLLGKDGIKSLTNDTQTLMHQQMQLAESMKAMGPLIEGITPLLSQAKGMLGGMDAKSLEGIKSLAKSFSVGQA